MPDLTPPALHRHPRAPFRTQRRAVGVLAGYLGFQWLANLAFLTLVAFLFLRSHESIPKIADFMLANRVLICGYSAILFAGLFEILRPLTRTRWQDIFHFSDLRRVFTYHALQGAVLAAVLVLGGLLAGYFSWLGIFMRLNEIAISFASAAVFSLGLFGMVVFEEFLLRRVLEPQFRRYGGMLAVQAASCVAYVAIKRFQFELTLVEMLNFALLNLMFHRIARQERAHMASATFAGLFFFTLHSFFGLPFLGQDMPGIFLLRALEVGGGLLSGGARGPENAFLLTVLLAVYLMLPWMRERIRKK